MDGVSAAASAIGVVGFALNSTREIYNFVSSIQNGPRALRQLVYNLQSLSGVLEELERSPDSSYSGHDLKESVGRCATDLETLKLDFRKLDTDDVNRTVKLWRNVKTFIKERDLQKASALINQYVTTLSIRLQMIEGKRGSTHTLSIGRVEALSSTHLTLGEKHSDLSMRTNTVVGQMSEKFQAFESATNTSHRDILSAIERLSDKIQHVSDLRAENAETSNESHAAILELTQRLPSNPRERNNEATDHESLPDSPIETSAELQEDSRTPIDTTDHDGLQNALDRLRHLAQENDKTIFCEDAEIILANVEYLYDLLLKAAEEEHAQEQYVKDSRGTFGTGLTEDEIVRQREIKRVKNIFKSSQSITINEKSARSSTHAVTGYRSKNTFFETTLRDGTVTFDVRRRYRRSSPFPQASDQDIPIDVPTSFEVSFAFLPKITQSPRIAVNILERMSYEGSFLRKPALSFSAVRPNDSKVFRLIEQGDLAGLIKSLSLRECFLTDRDMRGRCLLNHALREVQPQICDFLIDKGADVGFVEPHHHVYISECSSLEMLKLPEGSISKEMHSRLNKCRTSLLDAGADPMMITGTFGRGGDSVMSRIMSRCEGIAETWNVFFDHGLSLVEPELISSNKHLIFDILNANSWEIEMLSLIFRRQGEDGIPVQDLERCLLPAIYGSDLASGDDLLNALILLIYNGANVFATNNRGRSVSQIACCPATRFLGGPPRRINQTSSFIFNENLPLKKIWTKALTDCGYNAEEVISASANPAGHCRCRQCNCDTPIGYRMGTLRGDPRDLWIDYE